MAASHSAPDQRSALFGGRIQEGQGRGQS